MEGGELGSVQPGKISPPGASDGTITGCGKSKFKTWLQNECKLIVLIKMGREIHRVSFRNKLHKKIIKFQFRFHSK